MKENGWKIIKLEISEQLQKQRLQKISTPEEFQDQVDRYSKHCSGALPMEAESDGQGGRMKPTIDTVSPGMLEKLKEVGSPKIKGKNYKLFNKKSVPRHALFIGIV